MIPPQLHISLQLLLTAGMLPIRTVGEPGTQGAAVAGRHGMGVSTPSAAAVAAATMGLAIELHMPNGAMFTIGLLSMMLAAGVPVIVRLMGSTQHARRDAETALQSAPVATWTPMVHSIAQVKARAHHRQTPGPSLSSS